LIHHFDSFPSCKRVKPAICRFSTGNAKVALAVQQCLPISNLSFIENGALDISYDNVPTRRDDSMDCSNSLELGEQEDPPFFHDDFAARLLLDEDSDITDEEDSIDSDSNGDITPTFAMQSAISHLDTDYSTMAVYILFTGFFGHNEMPATLCPLVEANVHPAEEALLTLVVENFLPISIYGKIR
jgi:hypothetical protein